MVLTTETRPEVYFATMNTFISDSYNALYDTLTHMNSIKINIYPVNNITYLCAAILVDYGCPEISGAFNPEHLGCINRILGDTSDSRFFFWVL